MSGVGSKLPRWLPLTFTFDAVAAALVVYDLAFNDGPTWLTGVGIAVFVLGGAVLALGVVLGARAAASDDASEPEPPTSHSPIDFH